MTLLKFHPEARLEYQFSANYYLAEDSKSVSLRFVNEVEAAIREIREFPTRWRIVEPPDIRRRVLQKFPYLIFYRLEDDGRQVTVYAVMHGSRKPGYWRYRVP